MLTSRSNVITTILKNDRVITDRCLFTTIVKSIHSWRDLAAIKYLGGLVSYKNAPQIIRARKYSTEEVPKCYEAIQYNPISKDLSLVNIPVRPCMKEDEVMVKVAYSGICGTDLGIVQGRNPCKTTPVVLGHEITGVVEKVGPAVCHILPGDKVTVNPYNGCGRCEYCRKGLPHFCENEGLNTTIGMYKDGGWAQFCVVPCNVVLKIPDSVSIKHAVLVQPISCIIHALDLIQPIPIDTHILIMGAGITGTLFATLLRYQGYANVTISDRDARRLEMIKAHFSGYRILRDKDLMTCLGESKLDIAIECTGSVKSVEKAVSILRPGGKILIYGIAGPTENFKVSPYQIYFKEIKLIGATINPYTFPRAISWVETLGNKYLNFTDLGIRIYSLNDYCRALKALKDREIMKAVFEFDYIDKQKKKKKKKKKKKLCS